MTTQRWYAKANALASAWQTVFGEAPPTNAVVLSLAVAEHETHCGDSWSGEHNWGATTLRALTAAELGALHLAGIVPSPSGVAAARKALADAGLTEPKGALHADSAPGIGWYFVYFAAFADDTAGATYFVNILANHRSSCHAILESATGTEDALAAAMYYSHYYTGFVDPKSPGGPQANIDAYAKALRALTPGIRAALTNWYPGAAPPDTDPQTFNLNTKLGIQQALNHLGTVPRLTEDGMQGPKTRAAIMAFQIRHQLTPDGIVGPKTIAALQAELAKPNP